MAKISYHVIAFVILTAIFTLLISQAFADNTTNNTSSTTTTTTSSATTSTTTTSPANVTTTTTTISNSTTTSSISTTTTAQNQTSCPSVPAPQCGNNTVPSPQFSNGCVTGYNCISLPSTTTLIQANATSVTCPQLPAGLDQLRQSCQAANGNLSLTTDSNGCQHVSCIPVAGQPQTQLPSNCVQTTDNNGISHISCTQLNNTSTCQSDQILAQLKAICQQHGGTPNEIETDNCNYITCSLLPSSNTAFSQASCATSDQMNNEAQQCIQIGLTPKADFEDGCTVVKCAQNTQNQSAYFQASQSGTCQKTIPDQAVSTCQSQGGEVVVQRDTNGCITFGQCVARGDASQSLASPVQNVPSTTDLLSLAISLEQLKVQLYQAQSQVQTIANYYSTTSPQDAQRFQRVADMLGTAANKTNDIEAEIKSNIGNLTTGDLTQVKYNILYIKNVILKDAIYLMLGSNAQTTISTNQDCGSDSSCFDQAFRICEPSTFTPSADQPFKVTVLGLQGTSCQMKVELTSGPNAGSMVCMFSDYALGFSSNPQKFLSQCQGSLVSYMQQYTSQHRGST